MKKRYLIRMKALAAILAVSALIFAVCSCGAPAPSGMYAPVDAQKYVEGVEHAIFSVPEDYTVTMSSNTLAAVRGESSFSLQCRHSDYCYGDLKKNYEELKSQLLGLYGAFSETLNADKTAAGQKALEARYTLHISGKDLDFVQYFFYEGTSQFYLFTYTEPSGMIDEALLEKVLSTVSLTREGYTPPAGMRAVQNASVNAVTNDRFELYIPDDWILDTTAGQVCMRVPSKSTVSSVLFHMIEEKDLKAYVDDYAERFASDTDLSGAQTVEKYILASVRRMIREYDEFRIVISAEDTSKTEELSKNTMMTLKNDYLMTYTSPENVEYTYIEYTAKLADFNDHGSGGLFMDVRRTAEDDKDDGTVKAEAVRILYRVRQYFTRKGDTMYFFTYISTDSAFKNMENDAVKVVKNFVIK